MSDHSHNTHSDSDEDNEVYPNAVEFLLAKFPPETDSTSGQNTHVIEDNAALPEANDLVQVKIEKEDIVELPEIDGLIQVKNEKGDTAELPDVQSAPEPKEANDQTDEGLRFDSNFGATYGYAELNGFRWYSLGEATVCLKPVDINSLKSMENTVGFDSKFVSSLLTAVFSDKILKTSSAGGKKSNYNDVYHKALDDKKLKFVKDLFDERVLDDESRKKHFNKFVNKKCNNMRRGGNKKN